jgi:hypothetical protein
VKEIPELSKDLKNAWGGRNSLLSLSLSPSGGACRRVTLRGHIGLALGPGFFLAGVVSG